MLDHALLSLPLKRHWRLRCVMSYTTRLTPFTSLMMRVAIVAERTSCSKATEVRSHAIGRGDRAQATDEVIGAAVAITPTVFTGAARRKASQLAS